MFPPGWARLAMNPAPTGSMMATRGIVSLASGRVAESEHGPVDYKSTAGTHFDVAAERTAEND